MEREENRTTLVFNSKKEDADGGGERTQFHTETDETRDFQKEWQCGEEADQYSCDL